MNGGATTTSRGGSGSATATTDGRDAGVTDSAACASAAEVISDCSSSVPDFFQGSTDEMAECLCYDGSSWIPDKFDGYVGACATWAKTDNTAYYPSKFSIRFAPRCFSCTHIRTSVYNHLFVYIEPGSPHHVESHQNRFYLPT